jgi:hypothetical protein
MSELEGFQAPQHKPLRLNCAQLIAQGRPLLLFIALRTNMAVTPSLGEFLHRPDAPIELTGRAATCSIALCRPHGLPDSTATARSSNGHCAPTIKHDDRTCRCAHHPRAQRHDRTCTTQRLDVTAPASDRGLESSHRDRTRPIACDRTRRLQALAPRTAQTRSTDWTRQDHVRSSVRSHQ